jgi:hypothetical protein
MAREWQCWNKRNRDVKIGIFFQGLNRDSHPYTLPDVCFSTLTCSVATDPLDQDLTGEDTDYDVILQLVSKLNFMSLKSNLFLLHMNANHSLLHKVRASKTSFPTEIPDVLRVTDHSLIQVHFYWSEGPVWAIKSIRNIVFFIQLQNILIVPSIPWDIRPFILCISLTSHLKSN